MRYVTVTAADNTSLGRTKAIDLLEDTSAQDAWDALSIPMTILSFNPYFTALTTLYSVCSGVLPDHEISQSSSLLYTAGTNWTITYLQVYDSENKCWKLRSSVEYVTLRYFIDHVYYDPYTNQYVESSDNGTLETIYSEHYEDKEHIKERAAIAHENNTNSLDIVESVQYIYGEDEEIVIEHTRWSEYSGYEPA